MGAGDTQPAYQKGLVVSATLPTNEWSSGLFECKDVGVCLYSWFAPACANATMRTELDGSNWCFNCLAMNPIVGRTMVREAYGIEGDACHDICVPLWCSPCVTAQLLNEVRSRGAIRSGPANTEQWRTGLFDFDFMACVLGWCVPHLGNALALEQFSGSNVLVNFCFMPPALAYNLIREGYGIEGDCLMDICIMMWLGHCAVARLYQETKSRGRVTEQKTGPGTALMK